MVMKNLQITWITDFAIGLVRHSENGLNENKLIIVIIF
jgi:hypothetical protein